MATATASKISQRKHEKKTYYPDWGHKNFAFLHMGGPLGIEKFVTELCSVGSPIMSVPSGCSRRRTQSTRTSTEEDVSRDGAGEILLSAIPASRSWRYYVRWFARVALPIVLILSNVRVVKIPTRPNPHATALLLITHSRAEYLSRSLHSILSHHAGGERWPVVVSQDRQDGDEHEDVAAVVRRSGEEAGKLGIKFFGWAHEVSYEEEGDKEVGFMDLQAYRRISRHYFWALTRMFENGVDGSGGVERVVIVEDDMEVAEDFYEYFDALTPVLEGDPTLFCISAWNDNGIEGLALNTSQLHRTDFFPGLGWMMTKGLWEEVKGKWPKMFWDDWMRGTDLTKGRQCIRPEVSRTANFGENGVSQSFHYKKHVSKVVLSKGKGVEFSALDLSYLESERYHEYIFSRMSNAVQLRFSNYLTTRPQEADVIAFYPDENLESIGKRTGIMTDHREGIRRTSYKGVIVFPWNGHWAFVVPREWEPPAGYQLGRSVCCQAGAKG